MNTNLWSQNHPRDFWLCQPNPSEESWQRAIETSLPLLDLELAPADMDTILEMTLGESRFGPDHWRLSLPKQIYYVLKPLLPRVLTRMLRRLYHHTGQTSASIRWPVEDRYVKFLQGVLAEVLKNVECINIRPQLIWPAPYRFALVLTHDIETHAGQNFIRAVADLEESLGFRSSFNFVPELYPIDMGLVDDLRQRGFEIGIHGLKHDGKLFRSRGEFDRHVVRINEYLREFGAVGFRSPLTHRNPEWMQSLNIEYDMSFFDTDPFEPIPGGVMSIWPFFMGHFVELPYTLVQDYTLTSILKETTPKLWLEKVMFIQKMQGMALLDTHPDYLKDNSQYAIYRAFLHAMKELDDAWSSLPCTVARWWKERATSGISSSLSLPKQPVSLSED